MPRLITKWLWDCNNYWRENDFVVHLIWHIHIMIVTITPAVSLLVPPNKEVEVMFNLWMKICRKIREFLFHKIPPSKNVEDYCYEYDDVELTNDMEFLEELESMEELFEEEEEAGPEDEDMEPGNDREFLEALKGNIESLKEFALKELKEDPGQEKILNELEAPLKLTKELLKELEGNQELSKEFPDYLKN